MTFWQRLREYRVHKRLRRGLQQYQFAYFGCLEMPLEAMLRRILLLKRGLQNLQGVAMRDQQYGRIGDPVFQFAHDLGHSRHDLVGAFDAAVAMIRITRIPPPHRIIAAIGAEFMLAEETLTQACVFDRRAAAFEQAMGNPRGFARPAEIGADDQRFPVELDIGNGSFDLGMAALAEPVIGQPVIGVTDDNALLIGDTVTVAQRKITISQDA